MQYVKKRKNCAQKPHLLELWNSHRNLFMAGKLALCASEIFFFFFHVSFPRVNFWTASILLLISPSEPCWPNHQCNNILTIWWLHNKTDKDRGRNTGVRGHELHPFLMLLANTHMLWKHAPCDVTKGTATSDPSQVFVPASGVPCALLLSPSKRVESHTNIGFDALQTGLAFCGGCQLRRALLNIMEERWLKEKMWEWGWWKGCCVTLLPVCNDDYC